MRRSYVLFVVLAAACAQEIAPRKPSLDLALPPGTDGGTGGTAAAPGDLGDPANNGNNGEPGDLGVAAAPPDLLGVDMAGAPPRPSPIAIENQQSGDPGWQRSLPSVGLYGFADKQSYAPGEIVAVHAAADSATTATWELWRLGYYGGALGRRVASGGPVALPQAAPAILDAQTGLVRAPWATSFSVALPPSLVTGVYLVKLSSATAQSYVIFVVREPARGAPIVWPVEFNTYQAYNAWGGTSLYDNDRSDWTPWHAYAASFDRPYTQGAGAGQLFYADRDFITFVEGQGYDIDYVADSDVDADAGELAGRQLVVLQGHSEYWTAAQRSALSDAIDGGVNVAALGANDLYWQVRYASSPSGVARRVLVGYKEFAALDPAQQSDPAHVTTRFRDLGEPENGLLGVMFGEWLWSAAPFVIADPRAWVWTGAPVDAGALIPGLYGFEIDCRFDNGAEPAGLVELGGALAENHGGLAGRGQATLYSAPSGALVFASGTTAWSQALAGAHLWDARVQQATYNLFARLAGAGNVGDAPARLALGPAPLPPARTPGVQVTTVTAALTQPVAVAAASNGDALVVDGDRIVRVTPAGAVTPVAGGADGDSDGMPGAFSQPRGITLGADGTIYVADTGNHKLKRIVGGVVTTVAGSSIGFADGNPGQLDLPMSIGIVPTGEVVIADTNNRRLRAWTPAGLTTWAGNGKAEAIDGPGAQASLYYPFALAVLSDGSIVLAESEDGLVRSVAPDAAHTVSTLLGELGRVGWDDGPASSAAVSELAGLAAGPNGDLVLLDSASYRVRLLSAGTVTTLAGGATSRLVDGDGARAGFDFARAAAFSDASTLLVADVGNHALRRILLPRASARR